MSEAVNQTVEVPAEAQKTEVAKTPTRDELKAQGWSAKELEAAEKRGMLPKAEEKKAEEPKKTETPNAEGKIEAKPEEKKPEPEKKSTLPDFTFQTPEQEKAFLDAFGPGTPQRAMYFRMKNERQSRQRIERELEAERKARADLESRLMALERGRRPEDEPEGEDPEDRPLTVKELKALQEKEKAEFEAKQKEQHERVARVTEAQKTQEEYARNIYPDFDDTVKRAAEVMQNLEELLPEKWQQAKVVKLIRELQYAAANADQLDLDDYHAAMIAYEIGRLHPQYGKTHGEQPKETGTSKDPKANGGLTPEQMRRIEENTQRRVSSASVPGGGGRRSVSVDDVTLADLNRMSYKDREAFKVKYRDKYDKLLRG